MQRQQSADFFDILRQRQQDNAFFTLLETAQTRLEYQRSPGPTTGLSSTGKPGAHRPSIDGGRQLPA